MGRRGRVPEGTGPETQEYMSVRPRMRGRGAGGVSSRVLGRGRLRGVSAR